MLGRPIDVLEIFPNNGLDRSILVPVFVGMSFITFFTETLGWPFVALVVPGYLASVLIAAPWSGATIIAEALATYALARGIGYWVPKVGGWTVFFGRERFFLLIACSVLVRLASEGWLLPALAARYEFAHASELYSIGLVLVPLVANAFWNVGFNRGVAFMTAVTVVTYAVVRWLLLPYTNLALARFELTYESVALDFLGAPKAYLLLLSGTIVAARSNILYGWDYNGILVPGLLAVAWYSPLKLLSTMAEAIVVAGLTQGLVSLPLLRNALIEGPRRVLLVFAVGLSVKWTIGMTAAQWWPGTNVTDLYGFGYVLPTLVAVKIWQKKSVPQVVVPTLAVSLAGFLLGNAAGLGLEVASAATRREQHQRQVRNAPSPGWPLTLQSAWPLHAAVALDAEDSEAMGRFARQVRRGRVAEAVEQARLADARVVRASRRRGEPWWLLRRGGTEHGHMPALAVTSDASARGIVMVVGPPGGRQVAASVAVARVLEASTIVATRPEQVSVARNAVAEAVGEPVTARITAMGDSSLRIQGAKVSAAFWKSLVSGTPGAPQIHAQGRLNARAAADLAIHELTVGEKTSAATSESMPIQEWIAEVDRAHVTGGDRMDPRFPEAMRLWSAVIVPAVLEWQRSGSVDAYARAVAQQFGFRIFATTDQPEALVISRDDRTPELTWIAQRHKTGLVVEAPGAYAAIGLPELALSVAQLARAEHILLRGRRPKRAKVRQSAFQVEQSFYQRTHEELVNRELRVLALRAIPADHPTLNTDVVLSDGRVTPGGRGAPKWVRDLMARTETWHLEQQWYDGSASLFPYRGAGDPALTYVRRFAEGRMAISWWTSRVRSRFVQETFSETLEHLGRMNVPVSERALSDVYKGSSSPHPLCDPSHLQRRWVRYHASENPYALADFVQRAQPCGLEVFFDREGLLRAVVGGRFVRAFRLDVAATTAPSTVRNAEEARRAELGHVPVVQWRLMR